MHENEDIFKSLLQDNQEHMIEDEEQSRVRQNYLWLKIKGEDSEWVTYCKWGLKILCTFQERYCQEGNLSVQNSTKILVCMVV